MNGLQKPRRPRWPARPLAHESACHKVRTFSPEEAAELSNQTHLAWDSLINGRGTTVDFDTVATSLNAALVLCEPIGQDAVDVVIRAQMAAVAMQSRYHRTGTFGADATALADVPPGLFLYDQLLGFSNPLQMVRAVRAALERIENGDGPAPARPPATTTRTGEKA